jgi:hypothetical protein
MYHDPKNGKEYKKIIDDLFEKNKNKYNETVEQFEKIEKQASEKAEKEFEKEQNHEIEILKLTSKIEKYAEKYAKPERFFVVEALKKNPGFMDTESVVEDLQNEMFQLCKKNIEDTEYRHKMDKEKKYDKIRRWIKEKELSVHPNFFDWVNQETDENVLTSLFVLVNLKLYDRGQAYARQQILLNTKYWEIWRKTGKYSIEKLLSKQGI